MTHRHRAHYRQMIDLGQLHQVDVDSLRHPYQIGITFLVLQTLITKQFHPTMAVQNEFKNTQQRSNVPFARSVLQEPTISAPICVPILMSGLSFARFVAKLLHVNMTGSVTRVFTLERKNLFVKAS